MKVQRFTYNDQEIDFNFENDTLMVNATKMVSLFPDKRVNGFLETKSTQSFIKACLDCRDSCNLNIEKEEDLVTTRKGKGTWMHRILALEFAAWLSPHFKLWVYKTIDEIIFGDYLRLKASLKEGARKRRRMHQLEAELKRDDKRFVEFMKLKKETKSGAMRRAAENNRQLKMFYDELEENEGGGEANE